MKKNPIYMYVLLALSAMGTLLTAQSFFGLAKVEITDETAASLNLTTAIEREEYKAFLEKLIVALRGPIAWLLLSLLIGGLIAVGYFFLSKKDIVTSAFFYISYIEQDLRKRKERYHGYLSFCVAACGQYPAAERR